MKQLIQSYKTGELGIFDVPEPMCQANGILVRTTVSLVSAGTEKMIVDIAKKSLVGKAKARPDLVKQVINKMKQEGIKNTLQKVFTKLDTPIPLGYSCAGSVIEVGSLVTNITRGDRVACGGAGYANHSEINFIPKNLFVKIPDEVDDIDASFVTVGSIALQGVRQAEPALGENVAVIGLGLIGQITVQLLKANGCRVVGVDVDEEKLLLAKKLGADIVCDPDGIADAALRLSRGFGVDSTIITASTPSNQPIIDAGNITRLKGKVVVVGLVGMDIPRDIYYKKELDLRLSMAYGPGRYDPVYEEKGVDYPYSYVRWTEQRNFEAFLNLIAEGKVTPKALITHEFQFDDALKAYDLLSGKTKEPYLAIVLKYNSEKLSVRNKELHRSSEESEVRSEGFLRNNTIQFKIQNSKIKIANTIRIGLIGAGNFASSVLIPHLKNIGGLEFKGLCDVSSVTAHSSGKKHGFSFVTTNADEIINNPDIDAVFITTPHNMHAELVKKSLIAGKHVYTEKPLCISEDELNEISRIYSEVGNQKSEIPVLTVGFNRRYSPHITKMRTIIGDNPVSIIYRVNAGVIPKSSWIQDKEIGGGRIIGEMCHFIDVCSYLTGSLPVNVYAQCVRKDDQSIPDEDNVSATLLFANGSTAVINYTAYGNRQISKEYIELFGADLGMQMNDFRELIIFRGNKKERLKNANQDKGFKAELAEFLKGIKTGTPPISFESIYITTLTTFKILESLRTGQPISF